MFYPGSGKNYNSPVAMRCKNCGWENPQGNVKCEKCNAPLSGSMVNGPSPSSALHQSEPSVLKRTIPERQVFGSQKDSKIDVEKDNHVCPKCGYPIAREMNVCPNCGEQTNTPHARSYEKSINSSERGFGMVSNQKCSNCGASLSGTIKFCPMCGTPIRPGTINPWILPQNGTFCTLKPLAWQGENIEYAALSFSGEKIILNRANTEPNNQSITSKVQAEVVFDGGAWYLEDKSEQQTTYIHVGKKTKLESGDIIILGNRRFEFNGG